MKTRPVAPKQPGKHLKLTKATLKHLKVKSDLRAGGLPNDPSGNT